MPEGASFCPRCGGRLLPDGSFCPRCGLDVRFLWQGANGTAEGPRDGGWGKLLRIAGAWTSLPMLLALFAMTATAIWGAGLVLPEIGDLGITLFIIVPSLVDIVEIMGPGAVLIYMVFLLAVIASFIWMLYEGRGLYERELKGQKLEKHSALYTMATLFFALIFFQLIYYLVILGGQDVNNSNVGTLPLWMQLYFLLEASVWEEIITRVLYLGLPMMVVMALRQDGRQKWYRYLWGNFELDRWAMLFIFFSSAMFALGHLQNWDLFKLLPTFFVGLSLGYLFVRYGLYAAIMLHFSFDYLSLPSQALGGTLPLLGTGLLMLLFAAVGLPYSLLYAKKGLEAVLERPLTLPARKKEEEEEEYVYIPRLVCPYCGHGTIRVHDQDYECLNCKKRF
ncbi:MAG: CPBP family glutamic-type intramembrane protease [Candidatus Methanomethylophilaceae archaeon]